MVKISVTSHSSTATCGVFGYTKQEFFLRSLWFFMQHTVQPIQKTLSCHVIFFLSRQCQFNFHGHQQSPKMDGYLFWTHVAPATLTAKCLRIDVAAVK
jgi:hypothetical protein